MFEKATESLGDGVPGPNRTSLGDGQYPNWHFDHGQSSQVAVEEPSLPSQLRSVENENDSSDIIEGLKCSSTDSGYFEGDLADTTDTEMLDASTATSAPTASGPTERSTLSKTMIPQDAPVVYVDMDGDFVEMTSATTSRPAFRSPKTHQTQIQWGVKNPQRPFVESKRATKVSDSRAYHRSRVVSHRRSLQPKEAITAYLTANPSSQEPEIQILDDAIARNFSISPSLKIGPEDRLDDIAFGRWLKQSYHSLPQDVNEQEGVAVEDFIEEDLLVQHLNSLVISSPQRSASRSEENIIPPQKLDTHAANHTELNLRIGVTVELRNGTFLWIDSIRKDVWGLMIIKGYKLERDINLGAKLPDRRLNELVWINKVDEGGHRAGLESVLHEEHLSNVKRVREVTYTNCPWPKFSFGSEVNEKGLNQETADRALIEENERLCCRWKFTESNSRLKADAEASLRLLSEDEAVGNGKLAASVVRKAWRGEKSLLSGGNSLKPVFDVETGMMTFTQQYTIGDCFCGAGGISRGAILAGLKVAWGFDSDHEAIEAHKKNFERHDADSIVMDDAEFLDLLLAMPDGYRVDVAHYSPPCQPFSSANNHCNPEQDFMNQKALFSLLHLTERLKPRIATIEETAGLMHRHKEWFDTLVNIFTTLGYSVRWKIVRCQDHGIPQSRVRLLLTAAA